MSNTRKQLSKQVDKRVKKILSILPHKTQRNLRGLAVARIYHKIQDYHKVIHYLNLFIQAKNLAVAHKLIAHAYRMLKIPDLPNAMQHYYRCININPHQTGVIKDVCQLLLNEESIFSMECANYWLDLASSKNLDNDEAVGFLRVRVCLRNSYSIKRCSSLGNPSLDEHFLKTKLYYPEYILNESCDECKEKMKVIEAATDELKKSGAPEQPWPSSLQGQKSKKPEWVEEVITKKNKEMPLEQIAKQKLSKKEQEKPAGLDQGNASNPSTSSYYAPAVVAPTGSLRSSGRLSSLIPKPTRQHQKIDLKLKQLLFVHHAKLYVLNDGEWEIRGQGDVKILRDIKSKELRVIMRQKQALCLNHMLNTDVVYKPMDKKSWIFAAHDFSDGKDVLGRFALRFKCQNVAQEFNSVAKNALNGTAEAIKG